MQLEPSQIRNKWAVFQVFDKDIGKDEKLGEVNKGYQDSSRISSLVARPDIWLDITQNLDTEFDIWSDTLEISVNKIYHLSSRI